MSHNTIEEDEIIMPQETELVELRSQVNELRTKFESLPKAEPENKSTPKSDAVIEMQNKIDELESRLVTPKARQVSLHYETDDLKTLLVGGAGALIAPLAGGFVNTFLPQVPASGEALIIGLIGYGLTYNTKRIGGWANAIFIGMSIAAVAMVFQDLVAWFNGTHSTGSTSTTGGVNFTL